MKDNRSYLAENVRGDNTEELEAEALKEARAAFQDDVPLVSVPNYSVRRSTDIGAGLEIPGYKKFRANILVKVWNGEEEENDEEASQK
jgi:hypothetical protein